MFSMLSTGNRSDYHVRSDNDAEVIIISDYDVICDAAAMKAMKQKQEYATE